MRSLVIPGLIIGGIAAITILGGTKKPAQPQPAPQPYPPQRQPQPQPTNNGNGGEPAPSPQPETNNVPSGPSSIPVIDYDPGAAARRWN